jgi:hypothetical protein
LTHPKVYVATVHWNSDDWVAIQIRNLRKHIPMKMEIFAFVDGVSERLIGGFDRKFFNESAPHYEKLDMLASEISRVARDEDIILFIDGDAFPINNLRPVFDNLEHYPLVAVRRDENFGDKQPHPCFCVTTVGLWRQLAGTWKPGVQWMRDDGNMGSDVGGNLYGALQDAKIDWKPLLRSNSEELHPLFFGVYANSIYHHGAGFRDKLCRRDARRGIDAYSAFCIRLLNRWAGRPALKHPRKWLRKHVNSYMRRKNGRLHKRVLASLQDDDSFIFDQHLATREVQEDSREKQQG